MPHFFFNKNGLANENQWGKIPLYIHGTPQKFYKIDIISIFFEFDKSSIAAHHYDSKNYTD